MMFLNGIQNFLLTILKIGKFGVNNHKHMAQPQILFKTFFLKYNVKKFPHQQGILKGRYTASTYIKNIYYLTISVINKCFKFQNDWLK